MYKFLKAGIFLSPLLVVNTKIIWNLTGKISGVSSKNSRGITKMLSREYAKNLALGVCERTIPLKKGELQYANYTDQSIC